MKYTLLPYRIKRSIVKRFSYNIWKVKFFFFNFYNPVFNKIVKGQNKDFKKIPIIIINFNQLFYLKKLIEFLLKTGHNNIVVIDNNSTYLPLLNYYEKIKEYVTVEKQDSNKGHRVFWKTPQLYKKYGKGYYVITDPDIVPDSDCPDDFLIYFKKILDRDKWLTKVGFSLKINDIPDTNKHKKKIIRWESKFFDYKDGDGNFIADIDTTFALYRPLNQFYLAKFYSSIRCNQPYMAKHGGWYINHEKMSEEQVFYMNTANTSSSWKVGDEKELLQKDYE